MDIKIENFIENIKNRSMTLEIDKQGYKSTYTTLTNNFFEFKIFFLNLIEDQQPFYLTTQEKLSLKMCGQTIFKFTNVYFDGTKFNILSKSEIIKRNKINLVPPNFLITEFDYITN